MTERIVVAGWPLFVLVVLAFALFWRLRQNRQKRSRDLKEWPHCYGCDKRYRRDVLDSRWLCGPCAACQDEIDSLGRTPIMSDQDVLVLRHGHHIAHKQGFVLKRMSADRRGKPTYRLSMWKDYVRYEH